MELGMMTLVAVAIYVPKRLAEAIDLATRRPSFRGR